MTKKNNEEQIDSLIARLEDMQVIGPEFDKKFHGILRIIISLYMPKKAIRGGVIQRRLKMTRRWKLALNVILKEVIFNLHIKEKIEKEIVILHRQKRFESKEKAKKRLNLVLRKIVVLRRLSDHIPYQIFNGELSKIKRMSFKDDIDNLSLESINYIIPWIKNINFDKSRIAFPSDLSTYIQIGDLVVCDHKKQVTEIAEVKSGKKNTELTLIADHCSRSPGVKSFYEKTLNSKDRQQLQRIIKQNKRLKDLVDSINNNIDSFESGRPFEIVTFESSIIECYKKLTLKSWAINVVDSCLYIGMYKDEPRGPLVFSGWLELQRVKGKIVNITESFFEAHSSPITSLNLPKEVILDILNGRVVFCMCLDIEKIVEVMNSRFKNILVLEKISKDTVRHEYLLCDDYAIKINITGSPVYIGRELIQRVYFGLQNPLCVIHLLLYSIARSRESAHS